MIRPTAIYFAIIAVTNICTAIYFRQPNALQAIRARDPLVKAAVGTPNLPEMLPHQNTFRSDDSATRKVSSQQVANEMADQNRLIADLIRKPSSPEELELARMQRKTKSFRMYGLMLQEMNLSPDRRDRFVHMLVERGMVLPDLQAVAATRLTPDETRRLVDQSTAQIDQEIAQILAPEENEKYKEWNKNVWFYEKATDYAQRIGVEDVPLTKEQTLDIVQALSQSEPGHYARSLMGHLSGNFTPQQIAIIQQHASEEDSIYELSIKIKSQKK